MTQLPTYVDQAFAFAHGRIGVLQQLMLGRSDVDRLLGSHDLSEAEKILTELKLTAHIFQGLSREEEILDAVALWVKDEVEHMAPEEKQEIFRILWLENDAPFLAYLIKKQRGLTSAISREPQSGINAFDPAKLRALVAEGDAGTLPPKLVSAVQNTLQEETIAAADIDTRVAQYIASEQLALAKRSKSMGIRLFVQHSIDLCNIRTALRTMESEPKERLRFLLTGGTIKPQDLTGNRASIAHAVEQEDLGYGVAETIRKSADGSALERALSDVLAGDIALLWNVPLSVEPLFAFAALTLSQLKLLRVLLIGKRSGLTPQEIKKILPPFIPATHYVL